MSTFEVFDKTPSETRPYMLNWSSRMPAGRTIATVVWTVPIGLVKEAQSETTPESIIIFSGGLDGQVYAIPALMTDSTGEKHEWGIVLRVRRLLNDAA